MIDNNWSMPQQITKEEVKAIAQIDKNIKNIVRDYVQNLYSFKFTIWLVLKKESHKKVNQWWVWSVISNLSNSENISAEQLSQVRFRFLLKLLADIANSVWDREFLMTIDSKSSIVLQSVSNIQKCIDFTLVHEIKRINQSLAGNPEFFKYTPDRELLNIVKNLLKQLKEITSQMKTKTRNNFHYLQTLEKQRKQEQR